MMKKVFLICALSLVAFQTFAQDSISFDLVSAEKYAVEHNFNVKNQQIEIEKADKKVWETIAIGLPQIKAEGQLQDMIDIPTSVVDATLFNPLAPPGTVMEFRMGQQYSATGSVSVNQLIFDGSYIVGLQFSKFYKKIAQTNLEKTTVEVKAMVREAYYNVLIAQKNMSIMDSIEWSTKEMWEKTKIFYDNGFVLKEDVDQLELAYNRIKQNRINAANQYEIAKNLLKLQMGYDLNQPIEVTQTLDDVVEAILANNPALQKFNVSQNYNYIMLDQQMTLDQYAVKNEKAKYYPSVGAFFTHSQNAYRNEFDFFDGNKSWYPTTVLGVGVTVPITSSGQRLMKVKQAELKVDQDYNTLQQTEQNLEFQALNLKAQFNNAYEMMLIEKQNVELAKSLYKKSLIKKQDGVVNSLNVTQMQNQLLQAEGSYISAVMQMLKYKVELDKLYSK
jgi:outer membrane protein TolC